MGAVEMTPNLRDVVVVECYCLLVHSLRSLTVMLLVMVSWKVHLLSVHFLDITRAKKYLIKNRYKIKIRKHLTLLLHYNHPRGIIVGRENSSGQ